MYGSSLLLFFPFAFIESLFMIVIVSSDGYLNLPALSLHLKDHRLFFESVLVLFSPKLEWRISGRLPLTVDVPTNRSLQLYIAPLNRFRNIFEDFVKQLLTWMFYLQHIIAVPMFVAFLPWFYSPTFCFLCFAIPLPFSCLRRAISFLFCSSLLEPTNIPFGPM